MNGHSNGTHGSTYHFGQDDVTQSNGATGTRNTHMNGTIGANGVNGHYTNGPSVINGSNGANGYIDIIETNGTNTSKECHSCRRQMCDAADALYKW
jgi:hypothetical protein